MDFPSYSLFEENMFDFNMDFYNMFDSQNDEEMLSSETIEDSSQEFSSVGTGSSISSNEYASFVFGLDTVQEESEPDFATSVSSLSASSPVEECQLRETVSPMETMSIDTSSASADSQSFSESETTSNTSSTTEETSPRTPEDSAYLPSPPITPHCKRSVKDEDSIESEDINSLRLFTFSSPPRHHARRKMRTLSATIRKNTAKHTSKRKTHTSESKPTVGRDLLQTTKNPRIAKTAVPKTSSPTKVPRLKLDIDDIFTPYSSPSPPVCLPLPSLSKTSSTTKKVKGNPKARTTNNSVATDLSNTLNPTIQKRKYGRTKPLGAGKVCASYYPSSKKIVSHAPGERYPKGKPGKCAREDCLGDSKSTVMRHCISEYLQKGARGSSIPRHLRLHWCNKCYMRHRADSDYFPRLYSMILDQLEYVSSDGSGKTELFQLESGSYSETVDLTKAKEFVLGYWKKFASDGKERRFKVVPVRF